MIYAGSRYARARVGMRDGVETIVSRRKRLGGQRPDDTFYEVRYGDKLDALAHRFYDNGELWWVIAEVNNIPDPFEPLPVGKMLRIPSRRTVLEEVLP